MLSPLYRKSRDREYNKYPPHIRGWIACEYLRRPNFSHRQIDYEILKLDPVVSKGWQSMGVLHYQGLRPIHNGAMSGRDFLQILQEVRALDKSESLIADLLAYGDDASSDLQTLKAEFRSRVKMAVDDGHVRRRARLREESNSPPVKVYVRTEVYQRNPDVVAEALYLSGGSCDHCGAKAPFLRRKDGQPYLEVHHKVPLSEGGLDVLSNVVALCPNCHRKEHFG